MKRYPQRPNINDEIKLEAANELAKELDPDEGETAERIAAAYYYGMDGYDLAKSLEGGLPSNSRNIGHDDILRTTDP